VFIDFLPEIMQCQPYPWTSMACLQFTVLSTCHWGNLSTLSHKARQLQ